VLKYIVLPENSTDADLNGFIALCDEVKPLGVRLAGDIHNDFDCRSEQIIEFAIKLGREAVKHGHDLLVLDLFGSATESIKKQIFNR
jgi:hypothetical protein